MSAFNHMKRFLSLVVVVCFAVTSLQAPSAYAVIQETLGSEERDIDKDTVYVRALVAKAKKAGRSASQLHISRQLRKVSEADMMAAAASLGKDGREVLAELLLKLNNPDLNPESYYKDYIHYSKLELKEDGVGRTRIKLKSGFSTTYNLLGKTEEGWEGTLEKITFSDGFFKLHTTWTKEDEELRHNIQQIGPETKDVPEYKTIDKKWQRTGKAEKFYDIQNIIPPSANAVIGSLLLKLNNPDLKPESYYKDYIHYSKLELKTSVTGITFISLKPGFGIDYSLLGKGEGGWEGILKKITFSDGSFKLHTTWTKEDEEPRHNIHQIGPETRPVFEYKTTDNKIQRTGVKEEFYKIEPFDGSSVIGSLLLKLNNPDLKPESYYKDYIHYSKLELTVNNVGRTNVKPKSGFGTTYPLLGKTEEGWEGTLEKITFSDGFFRSE